MLRKCRRLPPRRVSDGFAWKVLEQTCPPSTQTLNGGVVVIEMRRDTMTRDEYEKLYAEALGLLRTRVAYEGPETCGGTRLLFFDGVPYDDQSVFEMVWDATTARDIMSKRPLRSR